MGNAQSGNVGVGGPNSQSQQLNIGGAPVSSGTSSKPGQQDLYNRTGYHVLQVQPNSPACGRLVPFFDFIVAANQVVFDKEDSRFSDTFKENIEKEVHLIVYNIKSDTTREQVIVPSNTWGGNGLAGISIRYCSWSKTLENVWHILDVYLNSPAHEAGLQTRTDYIVGTPDLIMNEQEDFFTLINNNMYRPIQLYIYSSLSEQVRLVTITPNKNWGGSGSLGCDIGYGLLHRIPTKQLMTSQMITPSIDQLKPMINQQQTSQQQESPYKSTTTNSANSNNSNNNTQTNYIDNPVEPIDNTPIKLNFDQLEITENNNNNNTNNNSNNNNNINNNINLEDELNKQQLQQIPLE
ncbi:golgi reassembly stacking protein [Heterostelium album PN500]|uniref:Golgi reassembly stacking protein n=1 Tax=Heterostelium pallidum (strain ATCC 26659 / Pp 5 / PN500) TaxID=670386 RepID=D3BU33_HETP5|nr:golgi reassembly stacking protein [Heterostelium album PN500]EFA75219.1 golgi reassembly stacking protein [Heterostelium album PN500]|eukprot:XP_020427353.1 golgi reassembly stacking protein [Heterostelium album PN500]